MQAPFVKHAVVYYDAVTDGGIDNTGSDDCVSDILAAVTAYKAAGKDGLYFPAGTYLLSSTLTVPDGTALVGSGMTTAWLSGKVVFGSTSSFTDLKIGPSAAGVSGLANVDGADGTSFTRCHFRGGGGGTQATYATMTIGGGTDVSNLTFTDCEVERSLGTSWAGSNDPGENTVSLYAQSNTIDTVTFDGCHFGVSNGTATGAQRMMVEVWAAYGSGNVFSNITFTGCEFEASNIHQLNFSCYGPGMTGNPSGRGTYCTVEDCVFRGGGVNEFGGGYGYGIVSESVDHLTITGNTFYRCAEPAILLINKGWPADNHTTISGNLFDSDTVYGGIVAPKRAAILLEVDNASVTGNTITYSGIFPTWSGCVEIRGATEYTITGGTGNTVTGNTFNHNPSQTHPLVKEREGATGNTITPNTENHI
jgi:hypothetical protein